MAKTAALAVKVEVKYDQSEQAKLAVLGPKLARQLQSVEIKDQATLDRLAEFVKGAEAWILGVDAIMNPVREATHAAWKAAIKAQDDFKAPVLPLYIAAKQSINRYIAKVADEARQRQLQVEADQRKLNEKNAEAQAKLATKAGADKTTVAEVRSAALAAPAPIVPPKATAPTGFKTPRMLYGAKITNMRHFLSALLADTTMFNLITKSENVTDAMESELRKLATMQKDAFAFAGVELTKKAAGTGE